MLMEIDEVIGLGGLLLDGYAILLVWKFGYTGLNPHMHGMSRLYQSLNQDA